MDMEYVRQRSERLQALRRIFDVLLGKAKPGVEDSQRDDLVQQFAEMVNQLVANNTTAKEGERELLRWMAENDADRDRQLRARAALGGPSFIIDIVSGEAAVDERVLKYQEILKDAGPFLPWCITWFCNEDVGIHGIICDDPYLVIVMVQDPPRLLWRELHALVNTTNRLSEIHSRDLPGKIWGRAIEQFEFQSENR